MVKFGKKAKSRPGDIGQMEILLDGKPAGYIEISYDDRNWGSSIRATRYVVAEYNVQIFAVDNVSDVAFRVRDYVTAQAALKAAKDYAKRVLTAPRA